MKALGSNHLLGCGERADEVHAALVEWFEEGIVLRDLDGEALGMEHFIGARRGRRQGRTTFVVVFSFYQRSQSKHFFVLKFPAL
jgi:hypothetical protein